MDEKESIETVELRQFANALNSLQHAFSSLADWLDAHEVKELRGKGTPTAKRAIGYLAGFTTSVLKAYAESQLGDIGPTKEDGGSEGAGLWSAERKLRAAGRKRSPLTHEQAHKKHSNRKKPEKSPDPEP